MECNPIIVKRTAGQMGKASPVPLHNGYERARALAWEWHHHRDRISASFRETLAAGWALPYEDYVDAMTIAEKWRGWLDEAMQGIDAILTRPDQTTHYGRQ